MGKLASSELQKLLDCITKDERVLVPPLIGYDAGVHRLGDQTVVVATDPCTGVPEEWFGWLLINYAASDVVLFGAKPQFCTINLLGPRPTEPDRFKKVMAQTCKAADELGIAIVRGHTGMYDSLKDLLGVCTVYGTVEKERLITPGNAKADDLILCTKPLGLEVITNFALTHQATAQKLLGTEKQKQYAGMVTTQTCVKEAQSLAQINGVHAMHDATEGGFLMALNELSDASKVGFQVNLDSIPFPPEGLTLQRHFGISDEQMLAMSSTGTILGAVSPQAKEEVQKTLKSLGLSAFFVGEFTENQDRTLNKGKSKAAFPVVADDPYTAIMATS